MGEINRAKDAVRDAAPPHDLTWGTYEDLRFSEAIDHLYQMGYWHGGADYEEEHRDDEPTWVKGARELALTSKDDKLLGSYVRVFIEQI